MAIIYRCKNAYVGAVAAVLCLALFVAVASAEDNPLLAGCQQQCSAQCDVQKFIDEQFAQILGDIVGTLDTLCHQTCGLLCGVFGLIG
ncbi:hypothetical protein ElyMa_002946400 [Elysia marginata]|uniref:Saposin B-type domain-containing protein n=1 Tax=Elysia marginata TaxID=1093978 RepID=A0AAV4I770_9GAST|nr:hypothetical protein ElyMa_002946400 [Elysia marginata]